MMNSIILVGRLVKDIELKETGNNHPYCFITLAVQRNYKNADGEYETDFIDAIVWNEKAVNINKYAKKGDIIGIEGSLETRMKEEGETKTKITSIVANKIHYIYSKKTEEVKED